MLYSHRIWTVAVAAALAGFIASGCRYDNPLYCATDVDCDDPALSYCDVDGVTEASEGIGHTCVPAPDVDAGIDTDASAGTDAGIADAGAVDGSTVDGSPVDAAPADAPPVLHDLTVVLAGAGSGVVVSSPAGIDCGATCVESFADGTMVTLTAMPDVGSRFVAWSGGCTGTALTCAVTLDAAKTVTATFEVIRVVQIAAGGSHTCALLDTGAVRCWGNGDKGRLGYGNTDSIGDDEIPAAVGDVAVGGTVTQIAAGFAHTCALLDTGAVRCWGDGSSGQLGYGNTNDIGDDEVPATAGDVDVGGTVIQIGAGDKHTCVLLDTGAVRCWGEGVSGRLGYGDTNPIGDDEVPATAGDVDVGGIVVEIAAGIAHTCALLDTGAVRCWGFGAFGQLGYGNTNAIGDDETPASAGDVDVTSLGVVRIAAGGSHTCAVRGFGTGSVRCWGKGTFGQLGYGNTNTIGDDETPASAGDVPL